MPGAVSKNLGHQNFYKMNHKWKHDCCTTCGCKREKREVLFPYMFFDTSTPGIVDKKIEEVRRVWLFSFDRHTWLVKRPECVRKNDDRVPGIPKQSEGVSEANSC